MQWLTCVLDVFCLIETGMDHATLEIQRVMLALTRTAVHALRVYFEGTLAAL